jgi:hypothetical protein
MNYVENNPVNPLPFTKHVTHIDKQQNNIVIIAIGVIIIGTIGYFLYENYQNKKNLQPIN